MKDRLKRLYREMKKEYLGEKADLVPEKYWSQFVSVGSASDWHYIFKRTIPKDKKRVLVIGVHGGRDYFYFKANGYDVVGQDLFPDPQFGEIIVGNVEDIKLPEKSFDVILISAVLEHLRRDFDALLNVRESLKDDGQFFLCVPEYNDWETTHIRIYNAEITRRLLRAAGFKVEKELYYPNIFFYPPIFNFVNHALSAIWFLFTGKTTYPAILPFWWKLEYYFSQKRGWLARFMRGILGHLYNGTEVFFISRKGEFFDQLKFNEEHFDTKK